MRFVDAVRQSTQDPFGGSMHFLEDVGFLYEREAYVFSSTAHPGEDGRPDFRVALFREEPFSATELSEYEGMSDSAKEAVLGFETVLLHELTHQIDTLTTPIAALLHMWQVEEFIRLSPVIHLLSNRPTLDISAPLARAVASPDHPVRAALRSSGYLKDVEDLLSATSQLRPFDGIGPSDILLGWPDSEGRMETGNIVFFRDVFEPVTLFGNSRTIRQTGARPVTVQSVLETHALSNCLRHILWRFRDKPDIGAREMARYLHCFYPTAADDYRFVFDAFSRLFHFTDIEDAVGGLAKTTITSQDQVPMLAGLLAWAALHTSQPAERLVYAADYLRTSINNQTPFESPSDVLRHVDEECGQLPKADDALELSRQLVREQRPRVPTDPAGLAKHFLSMLDVVDGELTTRIDRNYGLGDPVGTPNQGNPALCLTREQADAFGGRHRPDAAYGNWRELRTLLLARRRPSVEKHAAIARWLAAA